MACQTKNQCSYDDNSKVRLVEVVRSDGPRQCAANERLLVTLDYQSPGVWFADFGNGQTVTVETQGQPGTDGNWEVLKVGFDESESGGCSDAPVKREGGVKKNDCDGSKLETLATYGDGSTVYTLSQIDVYLNGTC
jgi:hypothetical protein